MNTKDIIYELYKINHPAINFSLIKLGILTNIMLEGDRVSAVFAFPFPNIPIAGKLIKSVDDKLVEMNLTFQHSIRVMNDIEREIFLELENKGWSGL
jgi:metal-sulfur cluster biosynthetic enzyme